MLRRCFGRNVLVVVGVGIAGVVLICMDVMSQGVNIRNLIQRSLTLLVPDPPDYDDILHEKRHRLLQETCKSLNSSNKDYLNIDLDPEMFKTIYVSDAYKFLYCAIAKVACSNGKRALLGLAGVKKSDLIPSRDLYHHHGKYYQTLERMRLSRRSWSEVMLRLRNYKKFVIIRDPYDRILSAWRDKLVDKKGWNTDFQRRYGTYIVKRYRKNATREAMTEGKDVTFREFVRYLIDPQTEKDMTNDHWQSYTTLCYPCIVNYDFILKIETLDEDIAYVRKKLKIENFKFPNRSIRYEHAPSSTLADEKYAEIPQSYTAGINEKFRTDFILFNYSFKTFGEGVP